MKVNINANKINNVISGDTVNLHENFLDKKKEIIKNAIGSSITEEIELLIAGDYQKIFNQLESRYRDDSVILKQVILLSARYSRLTQNKGFGVLTYEEQEIEYSKISEALLSILNK